MTNQKKNFTSANFPTDEEGRVYHLGLKSGEMANRIITVGCPARAITAAKYLDGGDAIDATRYKDFLNYASPQITIITSKRMFTTVTGRYKGTPVSIIAIGMGVPMMDFFVREARAIVSGELHIIRFGSCGSLGAGVAGDLLVADSSVSCVRNPDYFVDQESAAAAKGAAADAYTMSAAFAADMDLSNALVAALEARTRASSASIPSAAPTAVLRGLDVTADSFYGSQGRIDESFADANDNLFEMIRSKHPNAQSLQMETFQLLHLAHCVRPAGSIRAAAVAMVFANRAANSWITGDLIAALEPVVSEAVLDAIVAVPIAAERLHPEAGSLWSASA